MEQKKPISYLAAGGILAGILIVFSCSLYFTGNETSGAGWIQYLIIVGGLILFINLYGKAMNNHVTFGNLFAYGFKTTAFLTLIMIVFTLIFFFSFPDIKQKMFDIARQKMEERGNLTDDQIEKGLETWRKMFWALTIGGILLVYAIVGAVGSVIGAAVTKKKPVNPADQLDMR